MSTEATVVIKGRNDLSRAVKSAERDLKGLLKQGELFGKLFRGGAIAGALFAFERLAENAQEAAEKIGDRGTAQALKQLNSQIDILKAKGTNLIGKVLGNAFGAFSGDRMLELREQIDFLQRMQGRSFVAAGYKDIGSGFFTAAEGAAKLLELEKKLFDLRRESAPLGSSARTRALSRGGGSGQLVRTGPTKAPGGGSLDDGLEEMNIWARPIFNLANEQADAIKALNAETLKDTDKFSTEIQNTYHEMSLSMQEDWAEAAAAAENVTTEWTAMADQAARAMHSAFADFLFDPFKEGLGGMLSGFVDVIRRMVAEITAQQLLMSFFTWGANTFGGTIGSFFKGGIEGIRPKALGGPVSAGSPYLVGEKGPELFVPGTSGSIVPNGAMGVTINQYTTINSQGDDTRLRAALPGLLKQNKDQAVAEIRSLVGRGRLT